MQINSTLLFSEVNGLDKNRLIPFGVVNELVAKQIRMQINKQKILMHIKKNCNLVRLTDCIEKGLSVLVRLMDY